MAADTNNLLHCEVEGSSTLITHRHSATNDDRRIAKKIQASAKQKNMRSRRLISPFHG